MNELELHEKMAIQSGDKDLLNALNKARAVVKTNPQNQIKEAKEVLKKAGYISCFWHTDDITAYAESNDIKLTKKQVDKVRENIEKGHDANQGINWEVIAENIRIVKKS